MTNGKVSAVVRQSFVITKAMMANSTMKGSQDARSLPAMLPKKSRKIQTIPRMTDPTVSKTHTSGVKNVCSKRLMSFCMREDDKNACIANTASSTLQCMG